MAKERDGLAESFIDREQSVLVLDGDRTFVTCEPKRCDDALPRRLAMAVADCAKNPRAPADLVHRGRVEHPVERGVGSVDTSVLCVDMVQCARASEIRDGHLDVDRLPEEVAGVEVGADALAASLAEAKQSGGGVGGESPRQ